MPEPIFPKLSPVRHLGSFIILAVVLVLLSSELAFFSQATHPRFLAQADSVGSQQAILERRPFVFAETSVNFTSWRGRVFIPHLIGACAQLTGLSFSQSYQLVRWGSALMALGAFALLVGRRVRRDCTFVAVSAAVLALILLPTFIHLYEIPSDFPDAGFFALLLLFALEKRRGLFIAVMLVALLNRESALYGVIVWFVIHGLPIRRRSTLMEATYCIVAGGIGIALVLWLRLHFAVVADPATFSQDIAVAAQPLGTLSIATAQISAFFARPYWGDALFFLFGYNVLFIALFAAKWPDLEPAVRRVVMASGIIFLGSVPFANLPELRVYIPSLVLSTFALVTLLKPHFASL